MGARTLAAYVHVDGQVYGPGDTPPKDVADQITNPKAWGEVSNDEPAPGGGGDEEFDPSAVGIDEVNNHLADAAADEVARVLAAEAAGKNRKGIVEGPYAPDEA